MVFVAAGIQRGVSSILESSMVVHSCWNPAGGFFDTGIQYGFCSCWNPAEIPLILESSMVVYSCWNPAEVFLILEPSLVLYSCWNPAEVSSWHICLFWRSKRYSTLSRDSKLMTDCWFIVWRSPPAALQVRMRNRNCDNSLRQVLSKRIYKLLKTWSTDNFRRWPERSFPMPMQFI
jgi:hypothetical protein